MSKCNRCAGTEWLCEVHKGPWEGPEGCNCPGPGDLCPDCNPLARKNVDLTEKMAEAYWNAYRDGYYASGGKGDYPLWAASKDPVRNETYRCMRFAAEVLLNAIIASGFPVDVGPKPMTRQEAEALVSTEHKPLLDVMRDANT